MRYLLDTHIFIWWLNRDKRLKPSVMDVIQDTGNQVFISTASALEISIKIKRGKVALKTTLKRSFEISGFEILNINLDHALQLEKLPLLHKDPFDRILISQAKAENLTFITTDEKIWKYELPLLKA